MKKATTEREHYLLGEPIRIGNRRVLLVDDYFVEDRCNVARSINVPEKHAGNPVVKPDRPWEGRYVGIASVLRDETTGIFHMWYASADSEAHQHQYKGNDWDPARHGYPYFVCYARSSDGIEWEKPELDLIDYRGHTKTNIVHVGQEKCQGFRVIPNHPSTGQPGKYLLCYRDNLRPKANCLCLSYSDDGIQWREDPANPVMLSVRDTLQCIFFDEESDRWMLFTRPISWASQDLSPSTGERGTKRRVAVALGETPQTLHYPRCVIWPEEDEENHIDCFNVVRRGAHFLGFKSAMNDENHTEAHLCFSRDGLAWRRLPGYKPWIPRGSEGEFDSGLTSPPVCLVEVGDDVRLYYGGRTGPQGTTARAGIGLAIMRRDRFIVQAAGDRDGYLLTREFVVEGDDLKVNIEPVGSGKDAAFSAEIVRIPHHGIRTDGGGGTPVPVEGYSFDLCDAGVTDSLDYPVTWRGRNLAGLKGEAIQVRFFMRNCGIYSLQCA